MAAAMIVQNDINNFTQLSKTKKIYGIIAAVTTYLFRYFCYYLSGNHLETDQSLCPFKMITGFHVLDVELQSR
jgi:hypothetical protein